MQKVMEKIYKVVSDFSKIYYTDSEEISLYKVSQDYQEGSFRTYEEADKWKEYQTGDTWGNKEQYKWFKTTVTVPKRFSGKKIVFLVSTGHKEGWDISNPQFLIYVDDKLRQGLDVNHKYTVLSDQAREGRQYNIVMLGYSGIADQQVSLQSALKVEDPLLKEYYYNLSNLFWATTLLADSDYKKHECVGKMNESINTLDLRVIYSEAFYQSVQAANQILVQEYYHEINTSGPTVTMIGHTHIDVAWLWNINQTKEKVIRSFSTVLELMERYPSYTFMSSQPQLYAFAKEYAPELYEKIKEKVREGRWEVDGGMWVEADCNIPSGESLTRQFLYGTKFIEEEFQKECHTLWLPDVFGYSAALPQLIRKSGLSYMLTTKLDWNQWNRIPHDTFMWRGIDKTEVLTHLVTTTDDSVYDEDILARKSDFQQTTYNGRLNPNQTKGTYTRYQDKMLSDETLQLFGFGDGGGGPTEEMLENYDRLKYGLPGVPKAVMDQQQNFFKRLEKSALTSPYLKRWQGELYLEFHQGTYTSMAKNKRFNRKGEFKLQEVELIQSMASLMGKEYPREALHKAWKTLLLYQFHDIIPGTAIASVYEETDRGYHELNRQTDILSNEGMEYIARRMNASANTLMVLNMSSWNRTDLVMVPIFENQLIKDQDGRLYKIYYPKNENFGYFLADNVPAKGIKVYELVDTTDQKIEPIGDESLEYIDDKRLLCSSYYRLHFNEAMELDSIYDKVQRREILEENGRGNILQLFEDFPREFDNWNIESSFKDKIYEISQVESVDYCNKHPLYTYVEITRKYNRSTIKQGIYLYAHHPRIDFKTEVDWHEQHVLLKSAFEVDVNAHEATYDIQYGNIVRPTHDNTSWQEAQYEVCGHKWADISDGGYGVSLMNDCKYGYDIKSSTMRLSLIKCGTYPNEEADQGLHQFTYSLYGHEKGWRDSRAHELAYDLNVPLRAFSFKDLKEGQSHLETEDKEKGFIDNSLIDCLSDHVQIDTIKMAEDKQSLIIRCYEYKNIKEEVTFKIRDKVKKVYVCDLRERRRQSLDVNEGVFKLTIKGYEIVTLEIDLG